MHKFLKIALIGSTLATLFGVIGIPSVLWFSGISTKQFSHCIAWYAGFRDSAPRWPFVIRSLTMRPPDLDELRDTECEAIHCPSEKLTEIFKKFIGHIDPVTGQPDESMGRDPQGLYTEEFITARAKAKAEMCAAIDDTVRGMFYENEGFVACDLQDQTHTGVYVDDRATSILFFLIWAAVLGAPGSVVAFVRWMLLAASERKKEQVVQLRLD